MRRVRVPLAAGLAVAFRTDEILNGVVEMYGYLAEHPDEVLAKLEECTGAKPGGLHLRVGDLGELIAGNYTLVDQSTGVLFYRRGQEIRYRLAVSV